MVLLGLGKIVRGPNNLLLVTNRSDIPSIQGKAAECGPFLGRIYQEDF